MAMKTDITIRRMVSTSLVMSIGACAPKSDSKPVSDTSAARAAAPAMSVGKYADVNGLRMYYQIHGTGQPLVLLHGAMSNIDTDFGKILPTLAKNRQVIAIEQQGHGHTADVDRPLTMEQMADETAQLLKQINVKNADFFGYSMGGGVALEVAIRHPELVRKLIFAGGASYNPAAYYPQMMAMEKTMKGSDLDGTPFKEGYMRVAPNPANWNVLVEKIKKMDMEWKGVPASEVKAISIPTLLMIGDADIVRPEHAVEMFRLLGGGVPGDIVGLPRAQLAVLPGSTHVTLMQKSDWLVSMVNAFLEAPPPKPAGAQKR